MSAHEPRSPTIAAALGRKPRTGLPPVSILMYHQVGEFPAPTAHRASFCHVRRFRAQMAYLARLGYSVISLDQALAGLFGKAPLPARAVVLTFDDGYANFREHAWPVLQRHGFPATVFLVSGLIGKKAQWIEDDGRTGAALMDAATIRDLHRQGVAFGSHTVSHPRLARAAAAAMREEIVASKAALEDLLGGAVTHFCYPYGDYDARVRDSVIETGYAAALTCVRGAANTADNPYELPRKAISYGDNLLGYAWKLHMKNRRKDRR